MGTRPSTRRFAAIALVGLVGLGGCNNAPTPDRPTYTVVTGDSIRRIAKRQGISASELAEMNGKEISTMLYPGEVLLLPVDGDGETAAAGTTASSGPRGPIAPGEVDLDRVLRVAVSQLGDRYSWGAEGPDRFDCSGLVVYSFREAGLDRWIPHNSAMLHDLATPIVFSQARPGDLVFYRNSSGAIGHVGIYLGDEQMVEAPNKNSVVRISSVRRKNPPLFGRLVG